MGQAIWKNFTKEEIEKMFEESSSIKDFCVKMGYSAKNTHRLEILQQIEQHYNIDFKKYNKFFLEKYKSLTPEQIIKIALNSTSATDFCSKTGYPKDTTREKIRKILLDNQISAEDLKVCERNFLSQNKIEALTKEEFKKIIEESNNFTQACQKIGYSEINGQIRDMILKYANKYNISVEHFNKQEDLTGKKFENLLVIGPDEILDTGYINSWKCQCQCDKHTIVSAYTRALLNGTKTSCGCLRKTRLIDLTGQKFGYLTVLKRDKNTASGMSKWICKCKCGNMTSVSGSDLRTGHTRSCGCFRKSVGEEMVEAILEKMSISYSTQYSYINEESKYNKLRFDFAIFSNQKIICFIEYQGSQHYKPFKFFNGEEGLKIRQERDERKRSLAKKYNIPLLEIPYYDLNKIDSNYLYQLFKDNNINIEFSK